MTLRPLRVLGGVCLLAGLAETGGCRDLARGAGRAEVAVSRRDPGGGPPSVYRGPHAADVRHLLGRAGAWRTSRDGRTDAGTPPAAPIGAGCIRDTYVAAAVQHAWAAESYYRLGDSAAAEMAGAARADLDRAERLCPGAAGEGPGRCESLALWACPS